MNIMYSRCACAMRWFLTIAAAVFVLLFLSSTWRCIMWSNEKTRMSLERGAVKISITSDHDLSVRRRLGHAPTAFQGLHLIPYGDQGGLTLLWGLIWEPSPSGNDIYIIPLWIAFLVFAAPAVILWLISVIAGKKGNIEPGHAGDGKPPPDE